MQSLKLDSSIPSHRNSETLPRRMASFNLNRAKATSSEGLNFVTKEKIHSKLSSQLSANNRGNIVLELRLSVRGLISSSFVDSLSKNSTSNNNNNKSTSNSCFIAVHLEPAGTERWVDVGHTETAPVNSYFRQQQQNGENCLNQKDRIMFAKKVSIQYRFHERQLLRFQLFDGESAKQGSLRLIGQCEASLGEIAYSSLFGPFERRLTRPEGASNRFLNTAVLQISAEEMTSFKETVVLQFTADHLPSKMFKKHAFFYELHRVKQNGELVLIHRSQDVMARRAVAWQPFSVNLATLCSGNLLDETLRFSLWRRRQNGVSVKLISFFNTTTRRLMEGPRSFQNIYRMEKHCTVRLAHFEKSTQFSFLDYVHANAVQLHCVLAVDFSASNGPSELQSSLHHLREGYSNQYQAALRAVLGILQDYDSDKLFPAFGFGALNTAKNEISNLFNLNGNPDDPNCFGIDGVLQAYERAVRTVRMAEPSNFAPIIRHVSKMANNDSTAGECRNYYILLLLTDGGISDLFDAVNAVVDASTLPLSIIIIGIGNSDFTSMRTLDSDDAFLVNSDSCCMERDIVQFVPFSDVIGGGSDDKSAPEVQADLARDVLREIPDQFLSYLAKMDIFGHFSSRGPSRNYFLNQSGGRTANRSH